ncbi:MAG: M20 family metallopeptidase [Bacteroidales bacterium]|nr:M20 family metallopeptidase [Bacteroidales bacterium]MDY0141936.1 M20 family metallopeptidase [Bacteroidales bacterium]
MSDIKNEIKKLSQQIFHDVVSYRRHIHQYPELAFNEFETAAYIRDILSKNGIETDNSFGDNAVIGIIEGSLPGKTIGLRADIDALEIIELNVCEYKSTKSGIMHACGHDAHAASLLGSAIILNQLKDRIKGRIILVFQPAEEKNPGGAIGLIEKGLLTKYNISKMLGQHVSPENETGKFLFGSGLLMASTDELFVSFYGKGGHAALPHTRSDTVLALVDFISETMDFQKKLESEFPFIIAFGKIVAEGAVNVIPDETITHGTMRTLDEDLRKHIKMQLHLIAVKSAKKYNCTSKFEVCAGYPSLINDEKLTNITKKAAAEFIGIENIKELKLRMTAEDFAYYSREIPSVFYRFGVTGNGKGNVNVHNPKFDIDESSLLNSSALMAWLAIEINQ